LLCIFAENRTLLWVSLAVSQKFFVSSLHIFFSFTPELTRDGLIGGFV
jgi:hypothetical protein